MPLSLIEAALKLVPEEVHKEIDVELNEVDFDLEDLRQFWKDVKDVEDATFVTVESAEETVKVAKEGDLLVARTTERTADGAQVDVRFPFAVLDALFQGTGEHELDLVGAARALAQYGDGDIVTVDDGADPGQGLGGRRQRARVVVGRRPMFKLFGLTLLVGLTTSVQTVVAGAVFLAMGGVAVCRVETPDVNLFIPMPTQLADAGLIVARIAMPEQERERLRLEAGPWMPMVETITDALADLPNGTVLVSVETAQETVRVEKRLGRLTVNVDTEDADVHVSLPARSAKRIGRQLGMLI